MYHKILNEAEAGDQMGALIKNIKREELSRGMIVSKPGVLSLQDNVEAQVKIKLFNITVCILYLV